MTNRKLHVPEFSDDDISNIVSVAVKEVATKMRTDDKKNAARSDGDIFRPSDLGLDEAYVAQNKSYSMTTSFLSEPAKKHHEQLYKGYAEVLTRVSAEVDSADKENVVSTHSAYRNAKKDEVYNINAVYLHELFFANCFDPNSELFQDSDTYIYLSRDWGTFDAWMKDFMASALASRSGWVICGYSLYLKRMINVSVDGHDQGVPAGLIPLIVIDMMEHAFVRDYAGDKKSYLTSMMRELQWEVIEDRVKRVTEVKGIMG